MRSAYVTSSSKPLVAASILACDFAKLGAECQTVLPPGASGPGAVDALHLDVMDGHFVPNLTMGPDVARALRTAFPDATLDAHLMVQRPDQFVEPFARAGVDHLTFHIEPAAGLHDSMGTVRGEPLFDAVELTRRIHSLGMSAGVAVNPLTPPDLLLPALEHVDLVLVMSVHPGFAGQRFIEATLATTRALRSQLRDEQRLQMDGGLQPTNAAAAIEAGCDVLVAASAIFKQPAQERPAVVEALRSGARTGSLDPSR